MRIIPFVSNPWDGTFSEIIDVRSPSEFQDDHIPGALSLPVLDDQERCRVGTTYKQISPFEARKIGAALIAQRIGQMIEAHFLSKDRDYRPLIYCWRGGQRSKSLATVLSEIGFSVTLLEGGYKRYRSLVVSELISQPAAFDFWMIGGGTGVGKTAILHRVGKAGGQVLDLEAIAKHRGSLLGGLWDQGWQEQPSQRAFESRLLKALRDLDRQKPVFVEAESSKIGRLYLPKALWDKMQRSPRIEIQRPLSDRVERLLQEYKHLTTSAYPALLEHLQRLQGRHSKPQIAEWMAMVKQEAWADLVRSLLERHYDPSYRHSAGVSSKAAKVFAIADRSEAALDRCVEMILGETLSAKPPSPVA